MLSLGHYCVKINKEEKALKKGGNDLTVGRPRKVILKFSIPILLSALLQQFYSMVDTIVVGQFLGTDALAGVGATGSINFMGIGFCMGICFGFALPMAQYFGAKDYSTMRKFIYNSIWVAAGFGVIMAIVICSLCRDILIWMSTPDNILEYAYEYVFIIFAGIPITFAYNLLSGMIRSVGDSQTPFIILLLSAIVNIGVDIISVAVLDMGVAGPAYATLFAQLFSVILCLIVIKRKFTFMKIQHDEAKINWRYIGILCKMGIPMGLQYSITAIGTMILQVGINSLGSQAVAAVTAAGKISNFLGCTTEALGSTMATYTGQHIGAGKIERIRKGLRAANMMGIIYSVVIFVTMVLTSKYWLMMFLKPTETQVIADASKWLIINTAFYILLTFVNVFRFTIQGAGYSGLAIMAGVLEMIARSVVGVWMIPLLGFTGVCIASPVAWIMADAFLIPVYLMIMKKLEKQQGKAVNI